MLSVLVSFSVRSFGIFPQEKWQKPAFGLEFFFINTLKTRTGDPMTDGEDPTDDRVDGSALAGSEALRGGDLVDTGRTTKMTKTK